MPPEIDEIDCWLTDAIVCPYCGFEFGDCWEFGDSGRVDCDSCGQDFEFEAEHSVRYTSRKIERVEDARAALAPKGDD